jgi:hypothetical protein
MGTAQRGDDAIAFYAASLGRTTKLSAVAAASTQTTDVDGALPSGRYLIQILNVVPATAIVWVKAGPFEVGVVVTAEAGVPSFPLSREAIIAIEFNVVKKDSDRIAVRTSAGTADVYITRISRGA